MKQKQAAASPADTIVAVATAPGRGGIGIVRLSGARARPIGETLCRRTFTPRHAHYCSFYEPGHAAPLDAGIALYFPAPHSFTGEDVVELQGHGGPVPLDLLLRACCTAGASLARAGEFSERAYLNDKLDLAQAEAIADLIGSSTERAARAAARSLQGVFSQAIDALVQSVVSLRVYVEAAIDFPEEEIDFIAEGEVLRRLQAIQARLADVQNAARQGSLLREGMKVVIVGQPNVGKSSLLNALSGRETAIVTAVAGTTRDVLRDQIQLDGMPLHVVDTAGLRDSKDAIEREGIRRARQEMQSADQILLVTDSRREDDSAAESLLLPDVGAGAGAGAAGGPPARIPVTIVRNKCDLAAVPPRLERRDQRTVITLSAKTGAGIGLLREHLQHIVGFDLATGPVFSARRRHLEALQRAGACLDAGLQQLRGAAAAELLAEDLRQCHRHLGDITGAMSSDELLGEIFASFCIGK